MNWQNWEINLNLIRCLGFLGCSEHTCRYLNVEGVAEERTFVTGSPMAEVLVYRLVNSRNTRVCIRISTERSEVLDKGNYISSIIMNNP